MKPKIYLKNAVLILVALFIFNSCNEEIIKSTPEENKQDLLLKSSSLRNYLIEDYALLLSYSLTPEIKNLIKNEAKKKFDGDYNILAATIEDLRLNDGRCLKDVIKGNKR